jgi:hypothetical protein
MIWEDTDSHGDTTKNHEEPCRTAGKKVNFGPKMFYE